MIEVRLKEVAAKRGLTLYRIARETDIPDSLMSKYANGHVLPRIDRALHIAQVVGVYPSEIWILPKAA